MSPLPPVRLGLLALGAHPIRRHAEHLEALGAEVVAVFEPNEEAVGAWVEGRIQPARVYQSEAGLLADPAVEAVLISSPDRFHAESALAALRQEKHVLVEAPMAHDRASLAQLEAALREARARGRVLTSCHPRRFDRPYLWLQQALPELGRRFGAAVEFRFDFSYPAPTRSGLHSGLLAEQMNHEVDLLHFLFGRSPFEAYRLFDSEWRYQVAGIRLDGLAFALGGTRALSSRTYQETTTVRFLRGEVVVDAHRGLATLRDREEDREEVLACGATDSVGRFRGVHQNFLAAIRGSAPNYLEPQDLRVNAQAAVELTLGPRFKWEAKEPRPF